MLGFIFVLKFFSHSKHVLLSDDKVIKVLDDLKNEFLVLEFLSDSVAYCLAELIGLQNVAELLENGL